MSNQPKQKKSSKEAIFTVLRQISYTKLFKKYSSGDYSFNKISINNLVFNENCLVVARFKDFLIYDDDTELIRRFYPAKEGKPRLTKILNFYEKYSKIFPNYLVIKENKYLYRNIRKKQKMIDAFNEIKREEKENRKKLKIKENGKKNDLNELFTKKIKNEIKAYQNNISFKKYKNSFDSDKNNDDTLVMNQNSISIYYKQFKDDEKENNNIDSFITNQTNGSISNIVNMLNDNKIYTKDLPNILSENTKKAPINKNKKIKKGNDIKKQLNKKGQRKKETNQNSIKTINSSIKEDNENQWSTKIIKNNSKTENKKIVDKNNLYKYAITSSNATNSSSIISKKIKNLQTSSSVNKNSSEKNENKNLNTLNGQDNNIIDKNIILSRVPVLTSNKNLYQKTSPNSGNLGLKKNFYKTNNNFKKASLNKLNDKKEKYTINKEIVKKKYIKSKHISQDFDSNLVHKIRDNILNNKGKNNDNVNNIINTEKVYIKSYKNFLTNDNPNLITGDTKSNERNEKNFMEDKVIVNVRDIIKQEKEKEKSKKIFYTAQKVKNQKDNLLKLTKTKPNEKDPTKTLKFYKTKKNSLNTIDNNLNLKKNINLMSEEQINNNIRNNSLFNKQKTESKMLNKKLMTKEQKAKTKALFMKNKIINTDNKKSLINSTGNVYKTKSIFKKNYDIDKNRENKLIEKNVNTNDNNTNRSNKLYEIKYESTLFPSTYASKLVSERRMTSNLSGSNINRNDKTLTPNKKQNNKFKTKNHIGKTKNKMSLNNSSKFSSDKPEKKYKSFLVKNKNKINNEIFHNSQKNLLSINIINRIQSIKQNKIKNNFYTLKVKHSTKSNNLNNAYNSNNMRFTNNKTIKTPILQNRKTHIFKNKISKKLNIGNNENKSKEDMIQNCMSSFSIKVNKTTYKKDKGKKEKNKNFKKTWTKNLKKNTNQLNNNNPNELKK